LREAHYEAGLVGSVDAKRALAEQYIARGRHEEAVALYREALQGPFKDDTALLHGLARALFLTKDYAGTLATLDALKRADPGFISSDADLLFARSLELEGREAEALSAYKKLVRHFAGEEARARYGLLLKKLGQRDEADEVFREILQLSAGAPGRYRQSQKEWIETAKANL
jgi:hypothetical protein